MVDLLLQEMVGFFENGLAVPDVGVDQLAELLTQMHSLGVRQEVRPFTLPVVQKWLNQPIPLPTASPCASLITTLAGAVEQLQWFSMPPDYISEQFAADFAYTQIIGPPIDRVHSALFTSNSIAAGFSLQAPHLFYPPHYHQAVEFYGVLAGTARWQLGSNPPALQPPGTPIFHDSNVPHAMETNDEPLLAIWAWLGDLDSPIEVSSREWLINGE